MEDSLEELIRKSKEAVAKMTPEEYAAMIEEQKRSFVRGMTATCEHGVLDFEQCPKCRGWE
jgi:hypothetical protein